MFADSFDNLNTGDIFSIRLGNHDFGALKLLKVDGGVLNVHFYNNRFAKRPVAEDMSKLMPMQASDVKDESPEGPHVPMSRKVLCLWQPVFIANQHPSDEEMKAYRAWLLVPNSEVIEEISIASPDQNRAILWRIFLGNGLPYGWILGVYYGWRYGPPIGFIAFLIGGLMFGGFMVLSQWLSVRKFLGEEGASAGASQLRFMEISLPFEQAFSRGQQALSCLNRCRELVLDARTGTIEARTGINWRTGGEYVSLMFYRIDSQKTGLLLVSRPVLAGSIDYGKNLDNVCRIAAFLRHE